jgi:hypothetical protein
MEKIILNNIIESDALEVKLARHLHDSGIIFRILKQTDEAFTISVKQDPSFEGNQFDAKRLAEIVKETFSPHTALVVHARVVKATTGPPDVVTSEWIRDIISRNHISIKNLGEDLSVNKTTLSAYVNAGKPLSKEARAMFFYYFKAKGYL